MARFHHGSTKHLIKNPIEVWVGDPRNPDDHMKIEGTLKQEYCSIEKLEHEGDEVFKVSRYVEYNDPSGDPNVNCVGWAKKITIPHRRIVRDFRRNGDYASDFKFALELKKTGNIVWLYYAAFKSRSIDRIDCSQCRGRDSNHPLVVESSQSE